MAEHSKVGIRNARRDARRDLEALERDGEAGEDDVRRGEKELDRLTHEHEAEVDRAVEQKEADLLEV
jgi:ribosome recycling factor